MEITVFLIGIISVLLMVSSGYRLDKSDYQRKLFYRISLPKKLQRFIVRSQQPKTMVYTIFIDLFAYMLVLISLTVFIIAEVLQNGDWIFISATISFVLCALGTIQMIIEMIIYFIEEIKNDIKGDDF